MHVTSKYIYLCCSRPYWRGPLKFSQRNKDSDKTLSDLLDAECWNCLILKAVLNHAELQCMNEINYLSTKNHPKIAVVFACNITKEQHVPDLIRCLQVRSTGATVLKRDPRVGEYTEKGIQIST